MSVMTAPRAVSRIIARRQRSGTLIVKTSDMALDVVLRDQLRYLATTDLAPIVVAAGDSGRLDGIAAREGVSVRALPLEREPSPINDLRALWVLIRLMATMRPRVVIYGTPKATLLAGIASVLTRVPTRVQILHGLRLETSTGLARRLLLATERLAVRLATHSVAVGHGVRARCVELGIPVDRMSVIGRGSVVGIDTEHARRIADDPSIRSRRRAEIGASDDEIVLGFVGRVTRDKGVETLVRAVDRARSNGLPIRLAVLGPDEGIDRLDHDVQESLRAPWVTMTGNVPDPIEYYAAFDGFCIPSKREGLSTVVLEAWAAGVPVVVSGCTGLGDLVEHDRTGLVVPVDDVAATTNALTELLTDATLRARLRSGALAEVREHFSREQLWARCADFYRSARDGRDPVR